MPDYPSPPQELEKTISGLWREVLQRDSVGLDENFFDLGGNSLLMIQLHNKLQAVLNVSVPIMQLFQHTTVRSLANSLGANESNARSFQQLTQGKASNPFLRSGGASKVESLEDRVARQLAARRQFRSASGTEN